MVKCQNCGMENQSDSLYCVKCGTKISTATNSQSNKFCPNCGTSNSEENSFCIKCGLALDGTNNNICPYCHSEIEPGVLKCKNCGEWINKPSHSQHNASVGNGLDLNQIEPKTFIIADYVFTLIGIILTLVMFNTPYINLSGILTLDIIWIIITLVLSAYIFKNFGEMEVEILGIRSVKVHLLIILVINIILILFWITAVTWNPFSELDSSYY